MKIIGRTSDLNSLTETFSQANYAQDSFVDAGIRSLLSMYGAPKSEHCEISIIS